MPRDAGRVAVDGLLSEIAARLKKPWANLVRWLQHPPALPAITDFPEQRLA